MRNVSGFCSRNMFKRRHKQIWLLCSMFAFVLLFCSSTAFAAEETPQLESWIDHAADGFAGGTGTADDPYLIATAEQLAYLAKTVNEGSNFLGEYFKLQQDIDLAKYDWVAIGSLNNNVFTEENRRPYLRKNSVFSGNFDGNNKVIRNLTTKKPFIESGLFGYLRACEVKNLALLDVDIRSCFIGGGLAAQAYDIGIKNCYVNGNIEGFWTLGGIVGYTFWADICDCSVNVDIRLSNQPMPRQLNLHHNKFYDHISGQIPNVNLWQAAGGIIGYVANLSLTITIERCIVAWTISGGEELWIDAIAPAEGGTSLTITNCEIVKDFRMDKTQQEG